MASSCSDWEMGDIQFGIMRRIHDAAIGIADGDRRGSNALVEYRSSSSEEMTGAAGVGDA